MATVTGPTLEDHSLVKKERLIIRKIFIQRCQDLDKELASKDVNNENVVSLLRQLEDKSERIKELDFDLKPFIMTLENDAEIEEEFKIIEAYREDMIKYRSKCEFAMKSQVLQADEGSVTTQVKRRFKLPKLEVTRFNGDVKNWIGFWGQFRKIHDDEDIVDEDKFQYLLQSMEFGTAARSLVESFPPSGANYQKAIEQLKTRFARDELLIEIYVRELLVLVLKQAIGGNKGMPLTSLFDQLETQLRALDTLGVTSDKYAAMLYPLVESALPEDILIVWERHRNNLKTANDVFKSDKSTNYLQILLDFLKAEVESAERVKLARTSFITEKGSRCSYRNHGMNKVIQQEPRDSELYTAATILSTGSVGNKKFNNICLFCDSKSHASKDCFKARSFPHSQRVEIVSKQNACFACLKTNHPIKKCKAFIKCIICGRKHYPILCADLSNSKINENRIKENKSSEEAPNENTLLSNNTKCTLLQTVAVKIISESGSKVVRALLDSASQRSYILSDCAKDMNLQVADNELITQSVFGGVQLSPKSHILYNLEIQNIDSSFKCRMKALEQTKICNYMLRFENPDMIDELRARNIIITDIDLESDEISLLLGADVYGKLITGRIERFKNDLVAIETYLGWTLIGGFQKRRYAYFDTLCSFNDISITDLWNLEVLGIKDPIDVQSRTNKEAKAVKRFTETIILNENNRYEVELPWIDDTSNILCNKGLAKSRLLSTTKKLRTLNRYDDYDKIFKEWEELGIIEEVSESCRSKVEHYIPHHPVIKEFHATTKIRPVFDASAEDKNGNSLNNCLEKGPNLIELIPHILLKFRIGLIGVISDIKKAFLQISISPKDRDVLKFIWWSEDNKEKVYRHTRVVFGVTSSPFLLAATIAYHLDRAPIHLKETAKKLKESFYVDNCVTSVDNKSDLEQFIKECKTLMDVAHFDLRGWVYNSEKIFEEKQDDMPTTNNIASVLGLCWNFEKDTLFCNLNSLSELEKIPYTKRGLLSAAQRVFDPIGFSCPVTLMPKMLLQETWKLKINWDAVLPDEIKKKFIFWLDQIHLLRFCCIPRTFSKIKSLDNCEKSSLHIFCDASKLSYAACIFVRVEEYGIVRTHLLLAKSRIAPLKPATIPRLELLAAVIGCRLYQTVKKISSFRDMKSYFWSDSKVVLTWIKTKSKWNTFVSNRVAEIRAGTDINSWNHVSGSMNVADLLSRGCSAKFLLESQWWLGPKWLKGNFESWPNTVDTYAEEAYAESKKNQDITLICETGMSSADFLYFSQYSKIVRVIAWILRFYQRTHKRLKIADLEVTFEEYERAEITLIKIVQNECFTKSDSQIKNLQVFVDTNGLIRVRTKLVYGDDKDAFKYPILLPCKNIIVERLIEEQHRISCHTGVQTLLVMLRERFWIIRGRKMVKSVLDKCVICKRFKMKALQTPFAPLPKNRIKNAAAFEVTGIDLAGPLFLKNGEKAWIVLFTCAIYRACHFEVVKSLSTEAFLFALRRFIARRGRISVLYTDNGTNFVGANNQLKEVNWNEIMKYSTVRKIEWRFNPPTAAWWGGWWERMVRLIKDLLRKNLGKSHVNYEELLTLVCDCEAIINSRPLTYVSENPDDLTPITPSAFIQSIKSIETPDLDIVNSSSIKGRLRFLQKTKDSLRQRFRSEYLANLVHYGQRKQGKLKIGDLVLVGSDNSKRISWPVGRIVDIYPGRDNIARVARIKLSTGGEAVRPFQRIYPLEISSSDTHDLQNKLTDKTDIDGKQNDELKGIKETGEIAESDEQDINSTKKRKEFVTRSGRLVKQPERLGF